MPSELSIRGWPLTPQLYLQNVREVFLHRGLVVRYVLRPLLNLAVLVHDASLVPTSMSG